MADLADKIAAALLNKWLIGRVAHISPEWHKASADEVAAVIRDIMQAEQPSKPPPLLLRLMRRPTGADLSYCCGLRLIAECHSCFDCPLRPGAKPC
jgi:hypothetical protein